MWRTFSAVAMFSCVVAGRLPLPPPLQVDETHAVFQLEQADQINHVVVFMTGSQPFPEGYGATVHLMWPRADGSEAPWQMLGWYVAGSPSLLNTKPSAIFRVRGTDAPAAAGGAPARTATLGISIEPLEQVERQMQAMPGKAPASDAGSTSLALASRGAASGAPAPLAAQLAVPIGTCGAACLTQRKTCLTI